MKDKWEWVTKLTWTYLVTRASIANRSAKQRLQRGKRFEPITANDIIAMYEWQWGMCESAQYVGDQIRDAQFQLDHIIPLAAGGNHEKANLHIMCPSCNDQKGAWPQAQWDNAHMCEGYSYDEGRCGNWARLGQKLCSECYRAKQSGKCEECGGRCFPEYSLCSSCYEERWG